MRAEKLGMEPGNVNEASKEEMPVWEREAREATVRAEVDADKMLSELGVREGEPIPESMLINLLSHHGEELAEGVKRVYYFELIRALTGNSDTPLLNTRNAGKNGSLYSLTQHSRMTKRSSGARETCATYILGDLITDKQYINRPATEAQPSIKINFALDEDYVDEARSVGRNRIFRDIVAFEKMEIVPPSTVESGDGMTNKQKERPVITVDRWKGVEQKNIPHFFVPYNHLKRFLVELLKTKVDISVARESVFRLAEEYQLDHTKTEQLVHAIEEFANYARRPEIQQNDANCLFVPSEFGRQCENNYGLRIHKPHYGRWHYVGHDSEWRSSNYNRFHQVAVFEHTIVIDWTARQYGDYQYPLIYPVGKPAYKVHKYDGDFFDVLYEGDDRDFDDDGMLIPNRPHFMPGSQEEEDYCNTPYTLDRVKNSAD